jgi:hypothetical protein
VSDNTQIKKVEREARLRWVPIAEMRVSPLAQRELNRARVDKIAADFDLEQIGTPTVNERNGHYYIIDGQHRVEALREIGWGDQQIQCWTYVGLTEEDEAEKFLKLNDTLTVNAFAKFRVGVQAGRVEECDIDRIVRAQGLRVSQDGKDGAISAVGSLRRVYKQAGPGQLARSLRIIRDAYGDAGLDASVISGIGLLCARYDSTLDETRAVQLLSKAHGGVSGLLNKAETIRRATGGAKYHCVAAAAVEIINAGRGGKKLPAWFRAESPLSVVEGGAAS